MATVSRYTGARSFLRVTLLLTWSLCACGVIGGAWGCVEYVRAQRALSRDQSASDELERQRPELAERQRARDVSGWTAARSAELTSDIEYFNARRGELDDQLKKTQRRADATPLSASLILIASSIFSAFVMLLGYSLTVAVFDGSEAVQDLRDRSDVVRRGS